MGEEGEGGKEGWKEWMEGFMKELLKEKGAQW